MVQFSNTDYANHLSENTPALDFARLRIDPVRHEQRGMVAVHMEGGSSTPLGALAGFLAAEQPAGGALRGGSALLVLAAISVRCAIGLHPYSGMGKPPMFGDFEAQRHWMEITTSLPLADWYRETEHNDLQYWGIDYPPLTAYHSWVCGKVLGWLDPASMELTTSRGYETPDHKTAMRAAVLVRTRHRIQVRCPLTWSPCAYTLPLACICGRS